MPVLLIGPRGPGANWGLWPPTRSNSGLPPGPPAPPALGPVGASNRARWRSPASAPPGPSSSWAPRLTPETAAPKTLRPPPRGPGGREGMPLGRDEADEDDEAAGPVGTAGVEEEDEADGADAGAGAAAGSG